MVIESPFATAYLYAIVMLAPYVCRHFRDIHSRNVLDLDFDLGNGLKSFVNKPIERPYPCLFPIAMFALSVTVCEIFIVKCAWHWPWPLEWATVKYKYASRKATCEIICVGSSSVCFICHEFANSQMSSIRISDLESEVQGRWRFGWNLVDELIYEN